MGFINQLITGGHHPVQHLHFRILKFPLIIGLVFVVFTPKWLVDAPELVFGPSPHVALAKYIPVTMLWGWLTQLIYGDFGDGLLVYYYPLVICYITMENHHLVREFSHEKKVIFHSYVSLPEGRFTTLCMLDI